MPWLCQWLQREQGTSHLNSVESPRALQILVSLSVWSAIVEEKNRWGDFNSHIYFPKFLRLGNPRSKYYEIPCLRGLEESDSSIHFHMGNWSSPPLWLSSTRALTSLTKAPSRGSNCLSEYLPLSTITTYAFEGGTSVHSIISGLHL